MTSSDRKHFGLHCISPNGPIADHALRALASVARTECPVLILGEHGVGKRTAALDIHSLSPRSREPFREILCHDLDSQAVRTMLDTPGTVYMAEVADLTAAVQDLLLRTYFLSSQPWKCRILFGSSRELYDQVKSGQMREDLCALVSTITLRISPLRVRRPEILGIADGLLSQYSRQFGGSKPVLGDEIAAFLMDYDWPDNFAGLHTAMKTIAAIGDQAVSLAALKAATGCSRPNTEPGDLSLKKATRHAALAIERQMISRVLGSTSGNRKRAATELGISYKALLYKVKQLGLEPATDQDKVGALL